MKPIKKYSYLLLELLIALSLLSLFLAPMLKHPLSYVKKQKKELLSLYLHMRGETLSFLIEENLRKGEIPWATLVKSQKERVLIELCPPFKIEQEEDSPLIKPVVSIDKTRLKEKENGTFIGMTKLTIEFYLPHQKQPIYKTSSSFFISKKLSPLAANQPSQEPPPMKLKKKRKAKKSLTLLEVSFAISLAAILLGALWNIYHHWYQSYQKLQKMQSKAHRHIFFKQRLEDLCCQLSDPNEPNFIFTPDIKSEFPSLCFSYKGKADPLASFNETLRSLLYIDEAKQLCLTTWAPNLEHRIEILKSDVSFFSLSFFDPETNLWEDSWKENLSHLPLWIKITIKTASEEDTLQIRSCLTQSPILYLEQFEGPRSISSP